MMKKLDKEANKMVQLYIKENKNNQHRMTVRDYRGQILYLIEGSWGRKDDLVSLYTKDGQHLISIKQLTLSPIPAFKLLKESEKIGTMLKHPGILGLRDSYFTLHPYDWTITGDFEELYFIAYHDDDFIMECEKDIKRGSSLYELTIENKDNAPLCAIISVLFDHYSREKNEEEQTKKYLKDAYNLGFMNSSAKFSLNYRLNPKVKTKTR